MWDSIVLREKRLSSQAPWYERIRSRLAGVAHAARPVPVRGLVSAYSIQHCTRERRKRFIQRCSTCPGGVRLSFCKHWNLGALGDAAQLDRTRKIRLLGKNRDKSCLIRIALNGKTRRPEARIGPRVLARTRNRLRRKSLIQAQLENRTISCKKLG